MSSQVKYTFGLVPFSQEVYQQFAFWHQFRKMDVPPPPPNGIWLADQQGLVAGVGIYECDALFMLAENFSARPGLPPAVSHAAASLLADILKSLAVLKGKFVIACPTTRGIASLLRRRGLAMRPVSVMVAAPIPVTMFPAPSKTFGASRGNKKTQETPKGPRAHALPEETVAESPPKIKKGSRKERAKELLR